MIMHIIDRLLAHLEESGLSLIKRRLTVWEVVFLEVISSANAPTLSAELVAAPMKKQQKVMVDNK